MAASPCSSITKTGTELQNDTENPSAEPIGKDGMKISLKTNLQNHLEICLLIDARQGTIFQKLPGSEYAKTLSKVQKTSSDGENKVENVDNFAERKKK